MRFIIENDKQAVGKWVANYVVKRILEFAPTPEKPFVLGLPTGSTPLATYKELVRLNKEGKFSFQNVVTFNMDEYCSLARDHPESYHSFMWTNLFNHVDIKKENVNILDGNAVDLIAECDSYEQRIKAIGGIELFLGGIGPDGHIAFNEPGSSLESRTRVKTLAYDTIVANSRFFGNDLSKVPHMALTVGVGTVMAAREVVLLVTGPSKSYALYKAVEEGVSHMWTCSALQTHKNAMIVCDEDATDELRVKTVKYFKGLMKVTAGFSEKERQTLIRPSTYTKQEAAAAKEPAQRNVNISPSVLLPAPSNKYSSATDKASNNYVGVAFVLAAGILIGFAVSRK